MIQAIEGICGFIQLMFEKPWLLVVMALAVIIYITLIHGQEKPIKHHRTKTEIVAKFIHAMKEPKQ